MRKVWTKEENDLLRQHYPHKRTADILHFFEGRKLKTLAAHANVIGVKKSSAFFNSDLSGRLLLGHSCSVSTRFKAGEAAWNKGKKRASYLSAESNERMKASQFKKGNKSHNVVPIGYERKNNDGYIVVKVRDCAKNKNFEYKHHLVWAEHFGAIPKSSVLVFKDGNKQNFDIDNLELILKNEHINRNRVTDSSISKKFLGIREPELLKKFIAENQPLINQKRQTILVNQQINQHNARSNKSTN